MSLLREPGRRPRAGRLPGDTDGAQVKGAYPLPVQSWNVRVAASRHRTFAVADGHLVELGAGRPRVIARHLSGVIGAMAVDDLGRTLAAVGGTAVRYSARHGWRRLIEIPPP